MVYRWLLCIFIVCLWALGNTPDEAIECPAGHVGFLDCHSQVRCAKGEGPHQDARFESCEKEIDRKCFVLAGESCEIKPAAMNCPSGTSWSPQPGPGVSEVMEPMVSGGICIPNSNPENPRRPAKEPGVSDK